MQLRKQQQGLGLLGLLVILGAASFVLTCFFRIGPVYLEYWQVKQSLDLVLKNRDAASKTPDALLAAIDKQFQVSAIDVINRKDIAISTDHGKRTLDANYEKRVALLGNIDVVVKFDQLVYDLSSQ